jgi:hypothetical protein
MTNDGEPVAAMNREALRQNVGELSALGKRSLSDVVLVRTRAGDQLWVNPHYDNYQDAWKAAFPGSPIPSGRDVDHLYSRERAKQLGYEYVRLEIVPFPVNRGAGASWEKLAQKIQTPAERAKQLGLEYEGNPPIRNADPVQRSKLLGLPIGRKSDAWSSLRESARQLKNNPAAAAQANQLFRSLASAKVQFLRGNTAVAPPIRSTPAMRGAAAVLLLIEIGNLVVQVIAAANRDENHQNHTLINQLQLLHARELAEGRLLIPVLKVNVRPAPVLEREPETMDERNAQLAAAFDRGVYWEFESVEVSDYQRRAELANTTGQSASVAGKIIFPQFRSHMWNPYLGLNAPDSPLARRAWEKALDAYQEGLLCLSIESRNEALRLRQLAAGQPDPNSEKQAEYREKGFHWWRIPR